MTSSIFRHFPRDAIRRATVKHAGTSAGNRLFPSVADEVMLGALVQMTRHQRAIMGLDLRTKYLFFVNQSANILESDLVTIESITYKVANVDIYDYGSTKHKAALLTSN